MSLDTTGTGAALRQERLAQHLSLADVSGRTRISQKFLEAIETEAFDRLPGIVFARGFVRQYAVYLKMDPDPLLEGLPRVDLESVQLPDPAYYARPRREMPWKGALATPAWIALSVVAVAGAYFYIERPNLSAPAAQTPAAADRQGDRVKIAGNPTTEAAPQAAPAASTPAPAATTQAPAASTGAPPDNRAVQVVLTARQASWVQIVADGKPAFTGILNANDSRAVAADALVKVTAGNAGGVEISLNGKSLDPLGPSGQVRTVRLTAEGPEMVSRASLLPAPL